jgi:adenylate cyclase
VWSIGVAASFVVTAASAFGYFEGSQARGLDFLLRVRGSPPLTDVVIVAIDDAAFEGLQQRQPLPRDYLARVVRGLRRSGAAVVGVDIALTSATDTDDVFADELEALGTSVLVDPTPSTGPLATVKAGRAAADVAEDDDGFVRRVPFLVSREDAMLPSLGLAVAARALRMEPQALADRLGERAPGALVRLNLAGPAGTFLTLPSDAVAALADPAVAIADDNPLRGRVVLVGATFRESRDTFRTAHGMLPGVELHANVAHMALTDAFIRPSSWFIGLILQFGVVAFVAGVVAMFRSPIVRMLAFALAAVLAVPASVVAFSSGSHWIDFVVPVASASLLGALVSRLEQWRLRAGFARYVSKDVMHRIVRDGLTFVGERREATILFVDLRGFTSLSETMEPEVVAAQLNEWLEAMTSAIFQQQGMVNDFIGDGVMAIFNAPVDDPKHPYHATAAALGMKDALARLNVLWEAQGRPQLFMGIGIHTGTVFAGNVGGTRRTKYTLIGDAVNLASRVEGVNKVLGTSILITEATRARLDGQVTTSPAGTVSVKGRVEQVQVHELIGLEGGRT